MKMFAMNGATLVGLTSSAVVSSGSNAIVTAVSGSEMLVTSVVGTSHHHHHHMTGAGSCGGGLPSDDDDDMPSSPESFDDDEVSFIGPDDVTAQLAAAGPVGVAAAAAIASAKKRKRHHCFELNPSIRKRQQTRLLRKLKMTIDEFSTRVGQQAVVVVATPCKSGNNFKCFGAKPLEDVMKSLRQMVMNELENALAQQAPPPPLDDPSLHELPPLVVDGIPTPVEKMTQAQLRAFIPLMLKYSTGRGKPGWGKESTRPQWWPKDVPWANVRMDARSEEQKQKVSWTTALRQIVISCYKFHGRDDLLPAFSEEDDKTQQVNKPTTHRFVTVNVDYCQPPEEMRSSKNLEKIIESQSGQISSISSTSSSVYSGPLVQTISNPDGTVSLIQVDPNNPVIQVSDSLSAHVQSIAQFTSQNGDGVDSDGSGTVSIDINQVGDGSLAHEGTIILTSEDGTQIPVNLSGSYPVSGMITLPLPVYQTVVANIQGANGQHLQVVTPLMHVPKLEPDLDGGVEVSSALSATLDASTIITHSSQVDIIEEDENDIDMVDSKVD